MDGDLLDNSNPEALVIATGSLAEFPAGFVDGLGNVDRIELVMVDDLIEEQRLTGDCVLVVGGDQIGLQAADYLADQGKKVYLVERGAHFGSKMAYNDRHYLIDRLLKWGVKRFKSVAKVEILSTDDVWVVTGGNKERLAGIDTIVLASDRRPNVFLAELAEKEDIPAIIVGDANGVSAEEQGRIMAAITSGYEAGRQI